MNNFAVNRYALSISAAASLLAGCGVLQLSVSKNQDNVQPSIGAQGTISQALGITRAIRVLHAFGNGSDGASPKATLIDVNGMLYGTTYTGGYDGYGTVYSISTNGSEKVLYSFAGGSDGSHPEAALIAVDGTLYGTTYDGGSHGYGTVYGVSTSGSEKALYSFAGGSDGADPAAPLVEVNGTLYGTTSQGGGGSCDGGCGTVYSVSTAGAEQVLYRFDGAMDGALPVAGLVDVKGTLYGTTEEGGRSKCDGSPEHAGCGTVYRITTNGEEKVVHRFAGPDGAYPGAGLIDLNGTLYGTTKYGGRYDGYGTVFSITTSGKEHVLHSFGKYHDGSSPSASLLDVKGTLYGTTMSTSPCAGCKGTAFSVTAGGVERVLLHFTSSSRGQVPLAGLIDVNGTLYGTTSSRGTYGQGTVFAFKP